MNQYPLFQEAAYIRRVTYCLLQMVDPVASPGDPIFYLHHTWLDKLWWDWQTLNKTANLMAMGNSNIMPENVFGFDPRPPGVP